MFEQYGSIYHQNPSEINNPSNNTYERIYQSLIDGILYMRQSDGTDIPLSSGLGPIAFSLYSLFQNIASVGNVGAGVDTLYSNIIAASKLGTDGDEIKAQYSIRLANTLNSKTIRLNFAGINIFTSIIDYSTGSQFDLDLNVSIIRVNATDAKVIVSYLANGVTESQSSLITPLDFSIANALLLTGEGVVDDDIVANFSKGVFIPAI